MVPAVETSRGCHRLVVISRLFSGPAAQTNSRSSPQETSLSSTTFPCSRCFWQELYVRSRGGGCGTPKPNYHPRRTIAFAALQTRRTILAACRFGVLPGIRFAPAPPLHYDSSRQIMNSDSLLCDGCGQQASPEHTARRLQRLEWATRFRPVHIAALLLGAVSPSSDDEFLYSGKFAGEARVLLDVAGIAIANKSPEAVLSEFQRGGLFLTHVLECPLEANGDKNSSLGDLVSRRVPAVAARIRRSLKPKRTILCGCEAGTSISVIADAGLGCPVLLDDGKPFDVDAGTHSGASARLRELLAGAAAGR